MPWASNLLSMGLSFLICEMGLMVPNSCGVVRMIGEDAGELLLPCYCGTHLASSPFSCSCGTDLLFTLWLDGTDCMGGTSNEQCHHCVPVNELGWPVVSESEGAC